MHASPRTFQSAAGAVVRSCGYARDPVKGKLPIGPMPISPDMLSPETFPMNSSVNGIGLVIETFQLTASPLMAPSKISVEFPSAPCVPVSVSPEANRVSVALRSPIGVLMVRFQFPSTAIFVSPTFRPGKPEWLARSAQLDRRYSLSRHTSPTASSVLL